MARLVYGYFTSLDGHVADEKGKFDWAEPDEAVLEFVNELERPIRTHLYGRRMYETMTCWETDSQFAAQSPGCAAFSQIWKAAEKVVYSTTLSAPSTVQTRVARTFDSDAVRRLKLDASADISRRFVGRNCSMTSTNTRKRFGRITRTSRRDRKRHSLQTHG